MSAVQQGEETNFEVERPSKSRVRFNTPTTPCESQVGVYTCLVVSADPLRQLMFGRAAERSGWKSVVCDNISAAQHVVLGGHVAVAIVDGPRESSSGSAENIIQTRRFLEWLVREGQVLTVACGRSGVPAEEAWARQAGIWVYLPGVAPESDLDAVLEGARQIKSKRRIRRDPAHVVKATG